MARIKSDTVNHETLLGAVAATFADWVENGGVYDDSRCETISIYQLASPNPLKAELKVVRDWAVASLWEGLQAEEDADYADRDKNYTIDEELWGRYWDALSQLCRQYDPERIQEQDSMVVWAATILPQPAAPLTVLDMLLQDD